MTGIDKESVVPYYSQLADILKEKISSGVFGPDSLLPSERELCDSYDVSRSTVRQAMQVLKEQGLIKKEKGIGTRVGQAAKLEQDLLGYHNFDLQMLEKGHQASVVLLEDDILTGGGRVQRLLGLPINERILKIVRLRMVDTEPVFLEKIYMPLGRFPGLVPQDFVHTDIFLKKLNGEYGVGLGETRVFIEPVLLDQTERGLLKVKDEPAPGLMFERISLDREGKPVALTKRLFRGDSCRHMLVIRPQ